MNATEVLAAARRDLGYHESPPGSNNNKFSAYWKRPAQPWCADAATYWLAVCAALDVPHSSYTPALYQEYVNAGRAGHTPKVGALAFFQWPGSSRIEHVGLVEGVLDDSHVITLEGNTTTRAAGSQRNGGEVARKIRSTSLIVGYGYPKYAPAPSPARTDRVLMLGAKGQDVLNVQRALRKAGQQVTLDGQYGPATRLAVQAFQRAHDVPPSGNVGAETWKALRAIPGVHSA